MCPKRIRCTCPRPTQPGLVGVACVKVGKAWVIYVVVVNTEKSSIQVIADLLNQQ